jgi:hypothetical protein
MSPQLARATTPNEIHHAEKRKNLTMNEEVLAFERSPNVLRLQEKYAALLEPIDQAYRQRAAQEEKQRVAQVLSPLEYPAGYTPEELKQRKTIIDEYKKEYESIFLQENDGRIQRGEKPLPSKADVPDIIRPTPETYVERLVSNERFSDEELYRYLPEFTADERGENFTLTVQDMAQILQHESWLQQAMKIADSEVRSCDKEIKNLRHFNDLKNKKEHAGEDLDLTQPNYDDEKEMKIFDHRGDILAKKAFFAACLETRKTILVRFPTFLSAAR